MRQVISGLALAVAIVAGSPAAAAETREFNLAAGLSLSEALRAVALATGRDLVAPAELLQGRIAPALQGNYSAEDAFARLLRGSGLRTRAVGDALIVERGPASSADEDGPWRDIVVTGTRIRGRAPSGSSVIAISRAQIDASGFGTTQQVVQSLPQNYGGGPNEATGNLSARDGAGNNGAAGSAINLRGLGAASTLVLLNGNRLALGGFTGTFADVSLVPASIVERIEVLPDGASAIYGSDAVAGVVNILPRTSFEGFETRLRIGTADRDRTEVQASQLAGARWSGGHAVLAYEYSFSGALHARDRVFATEDLRRFGGPDQRQRFASPGTIFAGGQYFGIPSGQDGRRLTPGQLLPGQINLADQWALVDLLPRQRRHSVYGLVEQQVGDKMTLFAEGLFAHRRFSKAIYPAENNNAVTVTPANPFYVDPIGTGEPVSVFYSFQRDIGPEMDRGYARSLGGAAGARADLGPWSVEVRGSGSEQREQSNRENLVNRVRLAAALADPDPATAYNVFGDGPSTNPATIARVRGALRIGGRFSVLSASAKVDGPLFALPAGAVRAAIGGEVRREHFSAPLTFDDQVTPEPVHPPVAGLPPARHIRAGFAELSVPLTNPDLGVPLARQLDLSLALRVEDYSDFGTTTNPKLGARWEVARGIVVRGTYGTSFRAPGVDNLRQGPESRFIFAIRLPDPSSPTGQTGAVVLRGNKPGLTPETAETWTLGLDLEPAFIPGLRLGGSWYDIRYRDRIATPSDLFSFLAQPALYGGITTRNPSAATIAGFYADPAFLNFLNVPASAIGAVVDGRVQNLSSVHQSGLDLNAHYATGLGGGTVSLDLAGNIITRIDQAITATAPSTDVVSTIGNPVKARWRGSAAWTGSGLTVAGFVNRTSGYRNNAVMPIEKVRSWTTADLTIAYEVPAKTGPLRGLRLQLSATNLFDRAPPYVQYTNGLFGLGFNPDLSDPLGRVVSFQLVKQW